VALVQEHLRRNVLGRAAERVCPRAGLYDLREAKVRELRVAVLAQEDVLRLQIPVDDVLAMDVREGSPDLRRIKLALLIGKLPGTPEVGEELTAADTLHDDVNEVVILRITHHVNNEGVIDLLHQPLLVVDMVHLLELYDLVLLHEFNRIELPILLVLRELHPAERPTAQRA